MTKSLGSAYYDRFIGGLSVNEFLAPYNYDSDLAIADVMATWVWDEDIPSDFFDSVSSYVRDAASIVKVGETFVHTKVGVSSL